MTFETSLIPNPNPTTGTTPPSSPKAVTADLQIHIIATFDWRTAHRQRLHDKYRKTRYRAKTSPCEGNLKVFLFSPEPLPPTGSNRSPCQNVSRSTWVHATSATLRVTRCVHIWHYLTVKRLFECNKCIAVSFPSAKSIMYYPSQISEVN